MTRLIRAGAFLLLMIATATCQERDADLAGLSDRARSALAAKNWQEATQALEKLAGLALTVAEVQANLGLALYFEGRSGDALTAFERARKLNPALPQLDLMTGLCDTELGRYGEAIELLEPAFAHPPDDETGRLAGLHLARSYAETKQFDRAFATGEQLLRRYPGDAEILYQVSRLHSDRSYTLMSEYVGNVGRHLFLNENENQAVPGPGDYDPRRPFYKFGDTQAIYTVCNCDNSSYNGLQLKVQKRVTQGLDFLATYTFSKALDNGEGSYGFANSYDVSADHGPATFDRTHAFTLMQNWDLPFGRGRHFGGNINKAVDAVAGGWRFSGVTTVYSGVTFTPTISMRR